MPDTLSAVEHYYVTIHRVEGQMKEEGLAGIPFESILAECVFS